jgi:cystathionine gamma-lyase
MTAILHQLNPGDHIVCCDDVYGGTQRYLRLFSTKKHAIEVDFVDTTNSMNVKKALKSNTKLLWLESPTNPTLKVSDIKALSEIAHSYNKDIIVVADNTFLSPVL